MILELRRRHRLAASILVVLGPVLVIAAVLVRQRTPLAPQTLVVEPAASQRTLDFAGLHVSLEIWRATAAEPAAYLARARATEPLRLPDPLLYWSPTAPAADRLPGGAILVTPVGADLAPNSWAPPDRPGASGYLILYSLAHDRVAGSTPFSLPR